MTRSGWDRFWVWQVALAVLSQICRAANGHLEVAQALVDTVSDTNFGWQRFSFMEAFPEVPVVVVTPDTGTLGDVSAASDDPLALRLRNVDTTGFEISMAEPSGNDGAIGTTTFNYIAASVGVWLLNDTVFEVGRVDTSERVAANCRPLSWPNKGWTDVTFLHDFTQTPAVLVQIQTSNNEERTLPSQAPSVPWLTAACQNLGVQGMQVSLESSTAVAGPADLVPESVGYIIFEDQVSSGFELPSKLLESELMLSTIECNYPLYIWLNIFSENGNHGCLRELLARADCSQKYWNWGRRDNNCACVPVDVNCGDSTHQSVSTIEVDVYQAKNTQDYGCLSNVPAGCDTISDKQSCLTSMDGQDFTSSALSFMTLTSEGGRRCVWCDSQCKEAADKCEPLDYLLHFGLFKETFEVAQCTDAPSSIPFLTMSDILLTEDYESMDWSNPNWATASIAAGAWQSAAPLVIATQNGRAGSDGYWLRMSYGQVSASSVGLLKEEPTYSVEAVTYQQRLADGPFSVSIGASGGTESFTFPSVDVSAYIYNGVEFKDRTHLKMEIFCEQLSCLDTIRVGGDGDAGTWTVSSVSSETTVSANTWLTVSKPLTTSATVFDGTIPWTSLSTLEIISDQGLVVTIQNIDITNTRPQCTGLRSHGSEKASLVAFDRAFHVEVLSGTTTTTSSTSTSSSSISSSSSSSTSSSSTSSSTTSSSTTSSSTTSSSSTSSSTTSSSTTSSSTTSSSSTSSSTTSSSTTSSSSSTSGSSTSTSTVSISSSTSTGTSSSSTSRSSSTTATVSSTSTHTASSTSSSTTSRTTTSTTSTTSGSGTGSSTTTLSASTSTTVTVTGSSRTSTSSSLTFTATSTSSWATTTSSPTAVSRTSTSITETTSVAQNLQAAVLLELEQATGALLSELFSKQNSTASVASSPVGTMAALKLPDLSGVNDSFIPAILEDSPAAAILPAEALELAPGAVLVMTTFNEGTGSANPLGSGISASGSDGKSLASVVDAVDISLVDIGDGASRKVMVTTPIYVRLSDVAPATTTPLLCAFLDGDVWSQQGIRVATEEELNDFFRGQVNTTGLWCATTHLSIFSAFVDLLLDCTNVNVLSQDGLEEIFRNRWWFRLPALLLWLLLAALLVLLVVGVRQDRKLYSLGMWSDECFLTELPPVARRCSLSAAFSRWREQQQTMPVFSTEKSMESIAYLNEAFNDWMKKNHLQPRLSDKLQETILCQNTLREVALQHQVHPSFMVGHIWGPEGWVQGSLAMTKSKKLKSLQVELEEGLPQAFLKAHSSRMHRACSACVAAHPVCELWQWDLHITSAKRAKIIADCILGSLAFVALFFSVDGTAVAARSPENCPVQQGTFLWYTFVAIVSILLNLIPRGLIMYIAYRGFVQESTMHRKWQLRLLHFKDACFWTLGVLVSSIQLLVIIAFLANLSEVDEWKWLISFAVVLVRKMLLVPLLACLFASLGTEIAAWSQPSIVSQPPKKLGLDMDLLEGKAVLEMEEEGELTETWTQKVEELAQRGITIRQLLDFYASLGTLMPHFDPDRSTTHDVVRQAIIPNSLHYRNWRTFMVVVHQASDLAAMDFFNSDPYCIVRCVSSMPKPWKGGGRSATIKQTRHPKWEEAFLLYEVVQDESLHLSVWDQDVLSKDDALGEVSLAASDFWDGFDGTLPLQGPGTSAGSSPVLQITVTSYLQRSAAVDALEAFQVARRTRSKSHLRGWAGTRVFESEAGTAARESTEDEYCDTGNHVPIVINKDKLHDRSRCAIAASKGVFSRSLEAVDGESSSQWCCRDTPGLDEDLRNVGICILEEPAEERTERMEAIADQPEPLPGYAYASCVNMGQPQLGQKMVTHSWRNKFSFLLAAIIADALDSQLYDSVMQLLKDQKFEELCEALNRRMKLDVAYWVCAFSVNQHAGICASPDARDSTGHSIQPCSCCTAKHFQGDLSEMNKFDHMMALLKFRLRQDFSEVRLEQVVAMEPDFSLLTRIWCIAELVEAKKLHLPQAIMIHSAASRTDCLKRLFELDVRDANASFPADKELIPNKIPEVDAFNRQLKDLILHRLDHFLETNGSRLAATIVDELVLAFFTIAF